MFIGYLITFRYSPNEMAHICEQLNISAKCDWDPENPLAIDIALTHTVQDCVDIVGGQPALCYRGVDREPLTKNELSRLLPAISLEPLAANANGIFWGNSAIQMFSELERLYPKIFDIIGCCLNESENIGAPKIVDSETPVHDTILGFDVIVSENFNYLHSCIALAQMDNNLKGFLPWLNDSFLFSDRKTAMKYLCAYKNNAVREAGPLSIIEVFQPPSIGDRREGRTEAV